MKIAFYSPYLPEHFGGGEKYLLDTACIYAQKHQVFIALRADHVHGNLEEIKQKYEQFYGKSLEKITFIATPLGTNRHKLKKLWWTSKFDVIYYITDGSAFFSLARKNIMHIQTPLTLPAKTGTEKSKFDRFGIINTNSLFTKKVVEKFWKIKVNLVCHPGIDIHELQSQIVPKQKIILNVGRFFDTLHTKNQDVMVTMFRHLYEKYPELLQGWKLILVGSVESESYLDHVRQLATGLPIEIITNASREQLVDLYQRASIYWHATGCHDDEATHPEKMEHFGISTVEAMAAGCIPIVIGKGGQKEILGNKLRSLSWHTEAECLRLTRKYIKNDRLRQEFSLLARSRAEKFSLENFAKKCWQMLEM